MFMDEWASAAAAASGKRAELLHHIRIPIAARLDRAGLSTRMVNLNPAWGGHDRSSGGTLRPSTAESPYVSQPLRQSPRDLVSPDAAGTCTWFTCTSWRHQRGHGGDRLHHHARLLEPPRLRC
jgi:hypothetical protein